MAYRLTFIDMKYPDLIDRVSLNNSAAWVADGKKWKACENRVQNVADAYTHTRTERLARERISCYTDWNKLNKS